MGSPSPARPQAVSGQPGHLWWRGKFGPVPGGAPTPSWMPTGRCLSLPLSVFVSFCLCLPLFLSLEGFLSESSAPCTKGNRLRSDVAKVESSANLGGKQRR